jgi:hypothetical protein
LHSYAVRTACVAAMLRLGREPRETETLLLKIASDTHTGAINSLADGQIRLYAERASSLGYLWFHYWQVRWRLGAWWRCRNDDMPSLADPHYDRLLRNAISAASTSWRYIRERSELFEDMTAREIYVANQCLYYLVELGDEAETDRMESMQQWLMGFKGAQAGYWRQTYSDTLARYWAFRAERADDPLLWKSYMGHARTHFDDAKDAGRTESAVQRFNEYLTKREASGFVGPSMRPR